MENNLKNMEDSLKTEDNTKTNYPYQVGRASVIITDLVKDILDGRAVSEIHLNFAIEWLVTNGSEWQKKHVGLI
jgi:hypothetical protein